MKNVNIYYDDYLLHYGVKGMKWGVRHDPERVGRKRSRGFQPISSGRPRGYQNSQNKNRGLSSKAKRRLRNGALIAGGVLAVGAAVYLTRGKAFGKMGAIGKTALMKNHPDLSASKAKNVAKEASKVQKNAEKFGLKTISKNSRELDFKTINKDLNIPSDIKHMQEQFVKPSEFNKLPLNQQEIWLKNQQEGNLMNCTMCTQTGVMRSLGYDVTAGKSIFAVTPDNVLGYWKGAEFNSLGGVKMSKPEQFADFAGAILKHTESGASRAEGVSSISSALSKMPNGSKGMFNVAGDNGGHSLMFEVNNGKTKIIDNQLSIEYSSVEDFFKKIPHHNPSTAYWARLDNCKPNIGKMLEDDIIRKL